MNVAVIGVGYWGPNLVRNFLRQASVDKVYCFDIDNKRLSYVSKEYPMVKNVASYDEILSNTMIEAVAVSTPVATHYDLAKRALEQGKHVLIEKPLTANIEQAEELVALARERRLKLMVDHIFVYNGAIRKIKEIIDSGEIGDIMYFDAVRINLGLFQHDVNVIWDLATHDLSIMDYLYCEKPKAVSAVGRGHFNKFEDIAYLTLLFENDCIAHFHVNWLAPVKVRTILIGGSQKMIVYNEMETTEKIKIYDKGVKVSGREGVYKTLIQYRTGDVYVPKFDTVEPLANVVAEFITSIEEDRTPLTDGYSGLSVVKVLATAQESMKNNGVVLDLNET